MEGSKVDPSVESQPGDLTGKLLKFWNVIVPTTSSDTAANTSMKTSTKMPKKKSSG
jgi:hypothetical protein